MGSLRYFWLPALTMLLMILSLKVSAADKAKEIALANADKVRCKPYADRILNVRRKLAKKSKSLEHKLLTSDIVTKAKSEDEMNDLADQMIKKETAGLQRELQDAMLSPKGKGCPGNPQYPPPYDPESYNIEDPVSKDLDDK